MKLFRLFMNYILLVLVVLIACYSIFYSDNLTGPDTPIGQIKTALFGGENEATDSDANENETANDTVEPELADSTNNNSSSTNPYDYLYGDYAQQNQTNDASNKFPVKSDGEAPLWMDPFSERKSNKNSVDVQGNQKLWLSARQAFHQRDIEESIKLYEQLIANSNENYDAYGELGNVYFNVKQWKNAAQCYFDAAAILARQGQIDRAASALPYLRNLDQEKAEKLQAILSNTNTNK